MRARLMLMVALLVSGAASAQTLTVATTELRDEKAVFATVESLNLVPARVRTGGTIASLTIKEGDPVTRDQVIATIGDQKLVLQAGALDAQIAGLKAQLVQAQSDLTRTETLLQSGVATKARRDELATAVTVAGNILKARTAERAVISQQLAEGQVLSPADGRVVKVPVTVGTVVVSGETVATIAERDFVLRLRVPESHARYLAVGDTVRIDGTDLGLGVAKTGKLVQIYPQIQDGRVLADARVDGIGDFFVGERVRVWIAGPARPALIVPAAYVTTRMGLDYVRLVGTDSKSIEAPVQRGHVVSLPGQPDSVEILSGLKAGDHLVAP